MRLDSGRIVRNVICLVSLLAFASTPLAWRSSGIDLLDPEQVLRATEQLERVGWRRDERVTARIRLDDGLRTVWLQATHEQDGPYQYDDDELRELRRGLHAGTVSQRAAANVEWAQRFELKADSGELVSARACASRGLRATRTGHRAVFFKLRFYRNSVDDGRATIARIVVAGCRYNVEVGHQDARVNTPASRSPERPHCRQGARVEALSRGSRIEVAEQLETRIAFRRGLLHGRRSRLKPGTRTSWGRTSWTPRK